MRKSSRLLPLVLMLALLCACTSNGASLKNASPTVSDEVSQSPSPSASASPSPSAQVSPATVDNTARCRIFRTFLSDNYKALSDAFTGGISGIGFIDLDSDGGIEMVLFDSGASAALGAEFFDIVDGNVECVSSNLDAVAKAFGGRHLSTVTVNANRYDDFRLMKDKTSGKEFFIVQSGNGALDFKYTELVRFGCDNNNVLKLDSLMYKYQNTDDDSNVTSESYKVTGKTASKSDYDAASKAFYKNAEDMKYTVAGVFIWDSGANYASTSVGLQQMSEKAFSLWQANGKTVTAN